MFAGHPLVVFAVFAGHPPVGQLAVVGVVFAGVVFAGHPLVVHPVVGVVFAGFVFAGHPPVGQLAVVGTGGLEAMSLPVLSYSDHSPLALLYFLEKSALFVS